MFFTFVSNLPEIVCIGRKRLISLSIPLVLILSFSSLFRYNKTITEELFIILEDFGNLISSVWHKVLKNFVVVVIAIMYSFYVSSFSG